MATSNASLEGSGKDADVERVFKKFTFKVLQIIVQSRIEDKSRRSYKDSSSDYFSISLPDNPNIDDQIRRALDGVKSWPVKDQSVCVEIPLVTNDGDHMFLEVWDLNFNLSSLDMSASKIQHIFTRMGVTLKSLLCATRATPAYKLARNQGERGGGYRLNYRFYLGKPLTHSLGEGFKTVRAGAVPTAYGLLSVNVSYRTKLLLSPEMTASSNAEIEVTDNYFRKEFSSSPSSRKPLKSEPQPCSPPHRRSSLSSPLVGSESPYCFAVSPSSLEQEDTVLALGLPPDLGPWSQPSTSGNLGELPEPVIGAFSQRNICHKLPDGEVAFGNLMKHSLIARQEQAFRLAQQEPNSDDEEDQGRRKIDSEEKENIDVKNARMQKQHAEEDFVMVDKPPFAIDDDPRDVKAFLGTMFRAPNLYDMSDSKISVDEYISDVQVLVSRLEKDMPELDEFCQSIINITSTEEDGDDESELLS